ncbi:hypothetical protein GTA08_BOTSDO11573 [Neofusicoccum parvum]|nr:hypothetical protein GTA08_BOTSDO11573 [Neofusicoccum parvum]
MGDLVVSEAWEERRRCKNNVVEIMHVVSGVGNIIAIVQLGYKFANALKGYVDEVCAAEESIKALADEVEQPSNHIQNLSDLIEGDKIRGS